MRKIIQQKVQVIGARINTRRIIFLIGFLTFFFGFGAGAILNIYLLLIHSPLVLKLHASLNYKSAIFGDGILLPVLNMLVASFLFENWGLVQERTIKVSVFLGILITLYFNINQAVNNLINWAMPTPWHWNALGLFHGIYMLVVTSFLSLFYLTVSKMAIKQKTLPKEFLIVTFGIIIFFILLRIDYISINLRSLAPSFSM